MLACRVLQGVLHALAQVPRLALPVQAPTSFMPDRAAFKLALTTLSLQQSTISVSLVNRLAVNIYSEVMKLPRLKISSKDN